MQCNQAILHVWDHPRLCGEKASCSSQKQQTIGSPPPMRGKDGAITVVWEYFRITPAYAGKSMLYLQSLHHRRDHPRLCGEKMQIVMDLIISMGSPPPMRGKGCRTQNAARQPGITPAYAGKSKRRCETLCGLGDHPRLCGEKLS